MGFDVIRALGGGNTRDDARDAIHNAEGLMNDTHGVVNSVKDSSLFKSLTSLTPQDLSRFKWAAGLTAASVSIGALVTAGAAEGILSEVRSLRRMKERELQLQAEELQVQRQTLTVVEGIKDEAELTRRFQVHRAFVQDRDYAIEHDTDNGQVFVVGAHSLGYTGRAGKVAVWQLSDSIAAPRVTVLSALASVGTQRTVIRCQVLQCSALLQERGALLHFGPDGYISSVLPVPRQGEERGRWKRRRGRWRRKRRWSSTATSFESRVCASSRTTRTVRRSRPLCWWRPRTRP